MKAEMKGEKKVVMRVRITGRQEQMIPAHGSTKASTIAGVSIPQRRSIRLINTYTTSRSLEIEQGDLTGRVSFA